MITKKEYTKTLAKEIIYWLTFSITLLAAEYGLYKLLVIIDFTSLSILAEIIIVAAWVYMFVFYNKGEKFLQHTKEIKRQYQNGKYE